MKTFKEILEENDLSMSRGIFHPEQVGKSIIHYDKLYIVKETGIIDNWLTFKKGRTVVLTNPAPKIPKFYTRIASGRKQVYLCGSRAQTTPASFPGTGWTTKDKSKVLDLKPQSFKGITDKWMKIPEFKARMIKAIENRKDLSLENQEYLKTSVLHYIDRTTVTHYDSIKSNSNAVMKDYGEILGVLWFMQIHSVSELYLPGSGSYPLIDSLVRIHGEETQISSKATGVSNTIKGSDIGKIIKKLSSSKQKEIRTKYKNELDLLNIIQDNTVVNGTIRAFNHLESSIYNKNKKEIDLIIADKTFNVLMTLDSTPELIKDLQSIVQNVRVKSKLHTRADVLFLMSKHIENRSKYMNYHSLANDILQGYVVYVVAQGFTADGVVKFKKIDSKVSFSGAYLRYKGGRSRAADKLGLQLS